MREENNYRCLIDYMRNSSYEVHQRWDDTDAYREYEQKTKNYTKEKWVEANDGLMAIFAEFAVCKDSGASADSAVVQALVAKLQVHITENYYTCTDEILAGLGKKHWCSITVCKCGIICDSRQQSQSIHVIHKR